jgi:long-chain acyl-CoA synthetase
LKKNNTVLEMLRSFYNQGEKIAIKYFDGGKILSVTYAKLWKDVQVLTEILLKMQLTNRRVAILSGNSYYGLVSFFAVINAGFVAVLVSSEESAVVANLDGCGCKLVLFSRKFHNLVQKLTEKLQKQRIYLSLEKMFEEYECRDVAQRPVASCEGNGCCAIFYSSGTTGKSKGVMLSQTNIMFSVNSVNFYFDNIKKMLLILPMSHVAGLIVSVFPALNVGGTVFLADSFSFLKAINAFKPEMMVLVPVLAERLINTINLGECDVACLQYIMCSAAPMNSELAKIFESYGVSLLNAYGLTECGPIVSLSTPQNKKPNTVGKVVLGCQVKLVKNENGVGEIWVKGPNVMNGYSNNLKATRKVIIDGWLRTGDIGYLDEEGFLCLVGRADNIIVLQSGEKICPEKLEAQIVKSPYIEECLVKPIVQNAENIALSVDVVVSRDCGSNFKAEDVYDMVAKNIDKVNASLSYYEKIRKINIYQEGLAKTALYKLKR